MAGGLGEMQESCFKVSDQTDNQSGEQMKEPDIWLDSWNAVKNCQRILLSVPLESTLRRTGFSARTGVGKSSVCRLLSLQSNQAVLMESDILWRPEFDKPENKYRDYFEMWLRVSKNISQAGRPVVLFGAGMGVPESIEPCLERRYFPKVHYLALTCAPQVHRQRFYQGANWRKGISPDFLETHIRFNQWFIDNAHRVTPAIDLVDTTDLSVEETSSRVADWIHNRLNGDL